jgi:hypothetical protein
VSCEALRSAHNRKGTLQQISYNVDSSAPTSSSKKQPENQKGKGDGVEEKLQDIQAAGSATNFSAAKMKASAAAPPLRHPIRSNQC